MPTGDGDDELRNASAAGDLRAVAGELDAGGSVDSTDDQGWSALHYAANAGATEMVRYLLDDRNAAVDPRTKDGRTPLHLAAQHGHLDTVQILCSREADPDCPAASGSTPLHLAAGVRNSDVAALLLLHGAKPDTTDNQGTTPLHVAASQGRAAQVQLLLDEGAFADVQSKLGHTPLWMACENGPWIEEEEAQKAECAELFTKSNALMVAGQYIEAEKYLLASNELTIDAAEQRDCCKVASVLLERGADVNCADAALGHSPLTVAATEARAACRAYLRDNPPPEPPKRKLWEPEPEPEVGAEEIDYGKRVKVQEQLILLLLKAGADYEHANSAGHTAQMLSTEVPSIQALLLGKPKADNDLLSAAAAGIMVTAREARDNGASLSKALSPGTSTALHLAAGFGRVKTDPQKPAKLSDKMVKFLLDEGADINAPRAGDALTPLCMAAQAGHTVIVQLLLQRGADRNQPNHRGLTPLRYAAQGGHVDVAEILLHGSCTDSCPEHCRQQHAGARVNRTNAEGISPLWIAAHNGDVEMAHKLLVHHAQIDLADKAGATPLWVACRCGHEAMAQLLARGVTHHRKHFDHGTVTKPSDRHPRADVDRTFEGGLTPRWVASKRKGWDTSGWGNAEPDPDQAAVNEQLALKKQQEASVLELGDDHSLFSQQQQQQQQGAAAAEHTAGPLTDEELATVPTAHHVADSRRGWVAPRQHGGGYTPRKSQREQQRQRQQELIVDAFRSEGYAAVASTLSKEDRKCLGTYYESNHLY
jgi:cytohesin